MFLTRLLRVTGCQGPTPEREPEKRLPHPRKAAGAVIPAPIAYIKVAAVKKLVVGSG